MRIEYYLGELIEGFDYGVRFMGYISGCIAGVIASPFIYIAAAIKDIKEGNER